MNGMAESVEIDGWDDNENSESSLSKTERSRRMAARVREMLIDRLDAAMDHGAPLGDMLRAVEPGLESCGYTTAQFYEKVVEALFWEAFVDGPEADHYPGPGLIPTGGLCSVACREWAALFSSSRSRLRTPKKTYQTPRDHEGNPRTGRVSA